MPKVEMQRRVQAPIQAIWNLIIAMDRFPEYMPNVKAVTVLLREPNRTKTHWQTQLGASMFRWTEEDTFDPDHYRITYRQLSGDLQRFEGYWQLDNEGQGCTVTLTVDFEFGVPMLAAMLNPLAKKLIASNVSSMLDSIAQHGKMANN